MWSLCVATMLKLCGPFSTRLHPLYELAQCKCLQLLVISAVTLYSRFREDTRRLSIQMNYRPHAVHRVALQSHDESLGCPRAKQWNIRTPEAASHWPSNCQTLRLEKAFMCYNWPAVARKRQCFSSDSSSSRATFEHQPYPLSHATCEQISRRGRG